MTPEDLDRIEAALGVRLPESYRAALAPYPIPAAAGNSDLALWDDADRLIAYNLELRRGMPGGRKPWPAHFYAVGHPRDGSPYALDLRNPEAPVWWVDHAELAEGRMDREGETFEAWVAAYVRTLFEEMAGEEVDPHGSPDARLAVEAQHARSASFGCLATVAILVAIVALLRWIF